VVREGTGAEGSVAMDSTNGFKTNVHAADNLSADNRTVRDSRSPFALANSTLRLG
jgi:hypothetical protein